MTFNKLTNLYAKISDKILDTGSNAVIYPILELKDFVDTETLNKDKSWFNLELSRHTSLEEAREHKLVLKLGTISEAEANLLRQFPKHSNIIKLFAQNEATCDALKHRFIMIERVKEVCSDIKIFTNELIEKYLRDISSAFEYLHTQNVCFCDLSLKNSGLGYDDHFKIFDFGSIKTIGKKIANPKNANKNYCSVYAHSNDFLVPDAMDDYNSLFYVFLTLVCVKLPWMYLQFPECFSENEIDNIFGLIKLSFFPNLKSNVVKLWVLDIPLEAFDFSTKPNCNKKRKL